MVNKKGYLRTIEAIIAILLVFGFLVTVLPKTGDVGAKEAHTVPVDLDITANAFLEELERNEVFRACVLNDDAANLLEEWEVHEALGTAPLNVDGFEGASSVDCIYSFLETNLPPFSRWDFAFSLCEVEGELDCLYYPIGTENELGNPVPISDVSEILPEAKNIYPKAIFLSEQDIIAQPIEIIEDSYSYDIEDLDDDDDDDDEDEELVELSSEETSDVFLDAAAAVNPTNRVLRIYFWESG